MPIQYELKCGQTWGFLCTCWWCSMPMLMVLIRMAIMMPRLKYLLSTMPHSFILISCHICLQSLFGWLPTLISERMWPLLPFSLLSVWSSSFSVSSEASVSLLAPLQTGLTPPLSVSAIVHWGQPSAAEVAVRAVGSAGDMWSGSLW